MFENFACNFFILNININPVALPISTGNICGFQPPPLPGQALRGNDDCNRPLSCSHRRAAGQPAKYTRTYWEVV